MRVAKVILVAAAFLIALFTSILTLLMGVSRLANTPPGVESGLWTAVFVAAVGLVGVILLFFRLYVAVIAFGLAAGLTVTVIPPENGLPAALYAGGAVLALAAYFASGRANQVRGQRQRIGP